MHRFLFMAVVVAIYLLGVAICFGVLVFKHRSVSARERRSANQTGVSDARSTRARRI
jgi:hypothetical protein